MIGYVNGKYSGAPTLSADSDGADVVAFVALIVIDQAARGAGHAQRALREFAKLARQQSGAQRVRLRLDETGDMQARLSAFERMGFRFEGLLGTVGIEAL